jgi:hypothetical protein
VVKTNCSVRGRHSLSSDAKCSAIASIEIGPLSHTALIPSVWLVTTMRSSLVPGNVAISVRVVAGPSRAASSSRPLRADAAACLSTAPSSAPT